MTPFIDPEATLGERLNDARYALVLIHTIMEDRAEDNCVDPAISAAVARLAYLAAEQCAQLACALPPPIDEWQPPTDDEDIVPALERLSERVAECLKGGKSKGRRAHAGLCAVPQPEPEGAS